MSASLFLRDSAERESPSLRSLWEIREKEAEQHAQTPAISFLSQSLLKKTSQTEIGSEGSDRRTNQIMRGTKGMDWKRAFKAVDELEGQEAPGVDQTEGLDIIDDVIDEIEDELLDEELEEEMEEILNDVFYANCTDSALEHVFLPLLHELREIGAKHKRMLALSSIRLVLTGGALAACALIPPVLGVGLIATIGIAVGIKGGVFALNKVAEQKLRAKKEIELTGAEKKLQTGAGIAVTTLDFAGALSELPTEVLDTAIASVQTGAEMHKARNHKSALYKNSRLQRITQCKGLVAGDDAAALVNETPDEDDWEPGVLRLKGFHSLKRVKLQGIDDEDEEKGEEKKGKIKALTSALV
eukprot:Cvel_25351.t1-p1 / transcript=Cvel_25351.t1 / gene=Cvel_25351 / organism=Chromera_velia_CCMP2878 / gene_product=hypothetical protein / transcript_product=hypothetical protein / location=Cvel_scaffold2860:1563-3481(-) / protein_length=355 / sequence_SO=supercontig / SO=protein_coding / is_pseudo=false